MKNSIKAVIALISLALSLSSFASFADKKASCYFEVAVENMAKSKSGILVNGEKVSLKQLEKFSGVCAIAKVPMTEEQVKQYKIANLKARLAKLSK